MAMPSNHWKGGIILAALPTEGACMTVEQLEQATGLENVRITRLVTSLDRQGLIQKARWGCYRRTPAGDQALAAGKVKSGPRSANGVPRRRGGFTDQIWEVLRMMRKATLPEILEIAGTGGIAYPESVAARYLRRLAVAGVTAVCQNKLPGSAKNSPGFQQHVLVHDLGVKAPIWQPRNRALLDQNTGRPVAELVGGTDV
jgi:hypothetical protein